MIKKQQFFYTMTAADYRAMMGGSRQPVQKESKYHAQKTEVAGKVFDSKHESRDYLKLKSMEDSGIISDLQTQVSFELQPKYTTKDGRKIRAITYRADFQYIKDGVTYEQDSKGFRTKEYALKRKMFEYRYPDIIFVES